MAEDFDERDDGPWCPECWGELELGDNGQWHCVECGRWFNACKHCGEPCEQEFVTCQDCRKAAKP